MRQRNFFNVLYPKTAPADLPSVVTSFLESFTCMMLIERVRTDPIDHLEIVKFSVMQFSNEF